MGPTTVPLAAGQWSRTRPSPTPIKIRKIATTGKLCVNYRDQTADNAETGRKRIPSPTTSTCIRCSAVASRFAGPSCQSDLQAMLNPKHQNRSIENSEKFGTSIHHFDLTGGEQATCAMETKDIRVSIGDLLPPLLAAASENRRWIEDFQNDLITIPADLYEMVRESIQMRVETCHSE